MPDGGASNNPGWLDQVCLISLPPPTEITVANLNNSGAGSLRQALLDIADGGTITLDGGGFDRILIVDSGLGVTISHLTMTNGYGFQLAGAVLNHGTLTLDHVTVSGHVMTTNAGPTLTHALLAGSPAIDAADGAACPSTDPRSVACPQGVACDVGSFELMP